MIIIAKISKTRCPTEGVRRNFDPEGLDEEQTLVDGLPGTSGEERIVGFVYSGNFICSIQYGIFKLKQKSGK